MKIGFITDTNMIKLSDSELALDGMFNNTKFYLDYIDDLNNTKSKDELVYYMPKVVLEELINQKKDIFLKKFNNLIALFNDLNYALCGKKPKNNIVEYIEKEKNKFENKVNILDVPYNVKTFRKLVNDSLKKNPPFNKAIEGKKTDAGFKDALIWSTILESNEIDSLDYFYFFTCDKVFDENDEILKNEFIKFHSNTKFELVYLEPNGDQRQQSLQLIIKNHQLKENDTIKLYNESRILDGLISLGEYKPTDDVSYIEDNIKRSLNKINFKSFECNDFVIKNIKKISDIKYEVYVEFKTQKYSLKSNETGKRDLFGNVIIEYQKDNDTFIINNILVNNVYYELSNMEAIITFSNALTRSMHNLQPSLNNSIKALSKVMSSYQPPTDMLIKSLNDVLSNTFIKEKDDK